jgi:hypothetical protein
MRTFERWIRAAKMGGNPKVDNLNNASLQIQDDISRVDIFMNDFGGMDFTQNISGSKLVCGC